MLVALWDVEANGLLRPSLDPAKMQATKLHGVGVFLSDGRIFSGADQPGYDGRVADVTLADGKRLRNVVHCSIADALRILEIADLRVGWNSQDYDERVVKKLYPWWKPMGGQMDAMLAWRLLYPTISKDGPNTHRVPPKMRQRYSLEAVGYRMGTHKDTGFDPGDWQTWSPEMQTYMLSDISALDVAYRWAMTRKPSQRALKDEHDFREIILRQEAWGFTFDYGKALVLQSDLEKIKAEKEAALIDVFGEWWEPGTVTTVKATRRVKMPEYPDVTMARYNAAGKRLPKDYVGPPLCIFEEGAKFTPIKRVQFKPGSREHVRKMLTQKYGWRPKKFTDKGAATVDDDVLRALPYPEAPLLADYYSALKTSGYVSTGKGAWLHTAFPEGPDHRMHGAVVTIGTYTFRCAHFGPNMGQVPSRDPEYGHRCRELFTARKGFRLVGFDGSGMQLRLLGHYLAFFDGGKYIEEAFAKEGSDPHTFMQMAVGLDLMGEGASGRARAKTMNYALCFGGGIRKLGSIIEPHATEKRQQELGQMVKARMLPVFGEAFDALKATLTATVTEKGYITGLDGRRARVHKANGALSTLLQMGEGVVMKKSLVILDTGLQAEGLRPGVDPTGTPQPDRADYEFCANVHDEAQADVRPEYAGTTEQPGIYGQLALKCVTEAGLRLGVKCPLKSDVKVGDNWSSTH
jgi:DNA polymerase I